MKQTIYTSRWLTTATCTDAATK